MKGNSYEDAVQYFTARFLSIPRDEGKTYVYVTNATDTKLVQVLIMTDTIPNHLMISYPTH